MLSRRLLAVGCWGWYAAPAVVVFMGIPVVGAGGKALVFLLYVATLWVLLLSKWKEPLRFTFGCWLLGQAGFVYARLGTTRDGEVVVVQVSKVLPEQMVEATTPEGERVGENHAA